MATRSNASSRNSSTAQPRPARSRSGRRPTGSDAERTSSSDRKRGGGGGGSAETRAQGGREREEDRTEERRPAAPPRALTRGQRLTGTIQDAREAVTGVVAEYPVPATLIGAGLAWLLLGGRVRSAAERAASVAAESELLERARDRFEEVSEQVAEGLSGAAGSVRDALTSGVGESLSSAAGAVREGTSRLGEYAQQGARAVGSTVREGASIVGERARRGYDYSRQGVSTAWQQHPLTSGLALLAAGVAVGMLLPATRRENALMGRQADAVGRRVKSATRTLGQRGKKVVSTVASALRQEAEGEGLGVEQVARKVRRIAGHLQETTVNAAKRERLDPVSVLTESDEDDAE